MPLQVGVSIKPLGCLVERIGGEHVAVQVLVGPGRNPHAFEPTPRQLAALGRVKLFFKIGIPLEDRLLAKLQGQNRRLIVVDAGRGIKRRTMVDTCCIGNHDDRHNRHYSTRQLDPHVWLSPPLLKIQAKNIADALERLDPKHADDYRRNLAVLLKQIDAVHAKIARALKPYRGRSFYVFHPAFGYFADAYGLKQHPVEVRGRSPTPRQLRTLIKKAKAENVKIIFVQPQLDRRSAQAVAEAVGGAVVQIDPLAGDVLKNLEDIAAKIKDVFSVAPASRR